MKRNLVFLLAFFASVGVSLTSFGQRTNVDRIAAKVDNYFILRSEIENLVNQSRQQGQRISACQALESIAVQKLLVAKAEIDSVIVEPDNIRRELDGRMAEMARIYGGEKNIVEQFGKSIETLKNDVKQQIAERLTAEKMQGEITKNSKVTPAEVKKFFSKIPADSLPMMPVQVEIQQIVRHAIVTRSIKDTLIARLEAIKKRAVLGEDFGKLAETFSEDVGSRQYGGDLGWAKRGQMVPPFEAAAMRLKANEFSDIVESDFGFHLIQLLDKRGQEYHARHILLRPDYQRLEVNVPTAYLDSVRTFIVSDSISFDKAVKLHSQDEDTKYNGGFLTNAQTGQKRWNLDVSMDPTLYFIIDTMQVGHVSKVLPYRTERDEKTGVRLIKYTKKIPPHRANLVDDYELFQQYALSEKRNRDIEKWFKDATAEVYIKIDPEYQSCNLFGSGSSSGVGADR